MELVNYNRRREIARVCKNGPVQGSTSRFWAKEIVADATANRQKRAVSMRQR
jgi:hypothetical protein